MKFTYQLPVVAAFALAGVVVAEPEAEAVAPVAPPVAEEAVQTDKTAAKQAADIVLEAVAGFEGMLETLQGVQDKAGADAAAEKVAACSLTIVEAMAKADAMRAAGLCDGPEFFADLLAELESHGYTEESLEKCVEDLEAAVLKLEAEEPPFYGSEKLQAALKEFFQASELDYENDSCGMEDEPEVEITEEQMHQAEAALEQLRGLNDKRVEILKGVKDKETADAAAPQLEEIEREISAFTEQTLGAEYGAAFMALVETSEVDKMLEPVFVELDRIQSAEPPCYGSGKLAEVVGYADEEEADDDPAPSISEEQMQKAKASVDSFTSLAESIIPVLDGVTDKESADAAAPKIVESRQQLESFINQVDTEEVGEAWIILFVDSMQNGKLSEVFAAIGRHEYRLQHQDPPFCGSEALQNALFAAPADDAEEE